MSRPRDRAEGRASFWGRSVAAAAVVVLVTGLVGCPDRNRGISPVGKGLYFPSGFVLDPRVAPDAEARWGFALNANSDLVFNSGTIIPVRLDDFFAAWMRDPEKCFGEEHVAEACQPGQPPGLAAGKGDAWADWPVVGDVNDPLTEDVPCRRNALKPQVVECEDSYFLEEAAAVHVGNFGTALRSWTRDPKAPAKDARLFAAIRGDPSVTMVRVAEQDVDGLPKLSCGQGPDSGMYDEDRCAGDGLLKYLRNDPDGVRIASEPSNILAIAGDPQILVTHATSPAVTLIDMNGLYEPAAAARAGETGCKGSGADVVCKNGEPTIVDIASVFQIPSNNTVGGGWGLARRPCFPGTDNVPALSITRDENGDPVECGRPLIYAGFRTSLLAARLFTAETDPLTGYFDPDHIAVVQEGIEVDIAAAEAALKAEGDAAKKQALSDALARLIASRKFWRDMVELGGLYHRCLSTADLTSDEINGLDPIDVNTSGAFPCDPRIFAAGLLGAQGFLVGTSSASTLLGDIAFSRDGNRLFAVQTTPGALAYVDTSLDARGLTRDYGAGIVELCAQPTAMTLFADDANEYAAITCYKPAEMFIIDLSGVRVVANIVLGTGPHAMTVDEYRDYIYVANSLDKTISLVDISRLRSTRFSEVARLGLQVPYKN